MGHIVKRIETRQDENSFGKDAKPRGTFGHKCDKSSKTTKGNYYRRLQLISAVKNRWFSSELSDSRFMINEGL